MDTLCQTNHHDDSLQFVCTYIFILWGLWFSSMSELPFSCCCLVRCKVFITISSICWWIWGHLFIFFTVIHNSTFWQKQIKSTLYCKLADTQCSTWNPDYNMFKVTPNLPGATFAKFIFFTKLKFITTFHKHRYARSVRVIFCDLKPPGGSSTQWTLKSYDKGSSFTYTGLRFPAFNVIIEFNFLVQTLMIVVPKYFATILQNTFPSFSPFQLIS